MRTLSQLADHDAATVFSVEGHPRLKKRLFALGLRPGAALTVLRRAPLGDPIEVRIEGTLVSIRAAEAGWVKVES